ncbi:MAG: hypothetical protein ABWK05_04925 [Pyrobaculum sp.]
MGLRREKKVAGEDRLPAVACRGREEVNENTALPYVKTTYVAG